jgi:3-oxoacyl-[acyl-carrier protein] reductase
MSGMLQNQVAVITGGARGIGRAIAEALAGAGANLVLADVNAEGAAQTAAELAQTFGVQAAGVGCDVSKADACAALIEDATARFGKIDILVNNAGITRDKLLARMSEEDWQLVLNINLNSVYFCSKAAARSMVKQRSGRIISIASVVGIMGNAGQANYVAAKAGVIGLTKTTARELASRGVRCNAVAPGFIETDMTAELPEAARTGALAQIALKRFGSADDVAAAVAFLSGDEAGYITGQVLAVDGGMTFS